MQKNIFLGNFYFFTKKLFTAWSRPPGPPAVPGVIGLEALILLRKKADFLAVFLLFTARVRSRPPGPPAVPRVLLDNSSQLPTFHWQYNISLECHAIYILNCS